MIVQLPHAAEQTQQASNAPKMSLTNHDPEAFASKLQRLHGSSSSREQPAAGTESNDSSYANVSRRSLICSACLTFSQARWRHPALLPGAAGATTALGWLWKPPRTAPEGRAAARRKGVALGTRSIGKRGTI